MSQPGSRLEAEATSALEKGFENVVTPFQRFIRDQKTGSALLLCTMVALLIANSPLAPAYENLIQTRIGVVFGGQSYAMSLHHWVNDGLMALFFFVLGLEIKRELLIAKTGILTASLIAGLGGYLWLRLGGQAQLNR
jgi:NhaA family Na+:H+ antiporter